MTSTNGETGAGHIFSMRRWSRKPGTHSFIRKINGVKMKKTVELISGVSAYEDIFDK